MLWLQLPALRAHRLDEYLQAALIAIEPEAIRLRLSLTPGVESAVTLLPLLDRDGDGNLSALEASTYADLVRSGLSVQLDGRPIGLRVTETQFPALPELRTGLGTIQLELEAALEPLAEGAHAVNFENRHRPELSVYLINAELPRSPRIQVGRQIRNEIQSESRIEFTHTVTHPGSERMARNLLRPGWVLIGVAVVGSIAAGVGLTRRWSLS